MRLVLRARTNALCLRCSDAITPGEPCFERSVAHKERSKRRQLFHPECALDVDTMSVWMALNGALERGELGGSLVALRELAEDRYAAIERRRAHTWSTGYNSTASPQGYTISDPAQPREDDPRWVHPAHDASGRPRVRVLCAGSAFSLARTTGRRLADLLHAGAWASARREYVFEFVYGGDFERLDCDPAQPIVATLYAPIATSHALIEGERELMALRALGVPTPLLWLVGVSSTEPRDEHTLRFRELLAVCGFDGDACPVLCAPKITPAALDRVVAALDEHCDGAEWRLSDAPWRLIARSVRDDVRERASERYQDYRLGSRLDSLWSVADPATNALLIEAATQLVDREELSPASFLLERPATCDPALLVRWIRAALADDEAVPDMRVSTVLGLLERERPNEPGRILFDAIKRSKNADRTGYLLGIFVWQAARDDVSLLEGWLAEGLDDARATLVLETIAAMRNRFEMEDELRW